ncbi:energy-coupled thiamine transporter ThiT [Gudongella sp. SC589]|jgi:thiamine transporter|uniref:energy-coupled thiamine transporter ThiT n=1 Tax=Gudongella sp. SC589 TaxID=3385990 RepID=UPI003904776A
MEEKRSKVLMLTEGGMMIALSALLSYIRIYQAPNGGSVTAGSMIPIMIFAIRWGLGPGLAVGATYGLLDFILKPYFVHPLQLLFDYPFAFGSLGLAGIAYVLTKKKGKSGYGSVLLGVSLAILGRLVFHVLSGVVFFAEYAGDQNPWIYSIVYNATYLVPELIISMIVMIVVWKPIQKFIR